MRVRAPRASTAAGGRARPDRARFVDLDEYGSITTDAALQTSVEGVFAAGDVRQGSTKQAASAAGEGAV